MPVKIYTLANCDRCRAATKWLRARGLEFEEHPIRETPPGVAELKAMHAAYGDLRRLFNSSGREYREQKIADRLPDMNLDAAIELLASNGSLVKRPFLIGKGVALVGFDESAWSAAFERRR